MKILVVCQHYWPEPFRVHEICEELVARGHQVTAVVGLPNYPSGVIPKEYRLFRRRREMIHGVRVLRCFEIGRRSSKLGLAINYCSYMLSACWRLLWMRKDFDVVYAYSTSPVLMSLPASLLRCFCRIPLLIDVLDIWPACLAAMNVPESSAFYRLMKRVSRWVYRKADRLAYSSQLFCGYMRSVHSISVADEDYLPQFADAMFEQTLPWPQKSTVDLLFAGNIGHMQNVQVLLLAADLLRDVSELRWHIVGDGSDEAACRALAKKLRLGDIVTFHGRHDVSEMPAFYARADALLVSMKHDVTELTLPGKVQSYMAAGRPVIGSIGGETPMILQKADCGLCAPPDDASALAETVRRFLKEDRRREMGENARRYYQAHFTKQQHMDHLERMLRQLVQKESSHENTGDQHRMRDQEHGAHSL